MLTSRLVKITNHSLQLPVPCPSRLHLRDALLWLNQPLFAVVAFCASKCYGNLAPRHPVHSQKGPQTLDPQDRDDCCGDDHWHVAQARSHQAGHFHAFCPRVAVRRAEVPALDRRVPDAVSPLWILAAVWTSGHFRTRRAQTAQVSPEHLARSETLAKL